MDRSSNLSRLLHALGPGRTPPEPDWADMGTAYGLEMTLAPTGLTVDGASAGNSDGASPRGPAWWQRMVPRGGR